MDYVNKENKDAVLEQLRGYCEDDYARGLRNCNIDSGISKRNRAIIQDFLNSFEVHVEYGVKDLPSVQKKQG